MVVLSNYREGFPSNWYPERRDMFFWYRDLRYPDKFEGNIGIYQFCWVLFGIISGSFLLEGTF